LLARGRAAGFSPGPWCTRTTTSCWRRVLITSRSLTTGRTLRAGVPPQWLTEEELISFWADDQ
jgi:hypothetical protein